MQRAAKKGPKKVKKGRIQFQEKVSGPFSDRSPQRGDKLRHCSPCLAWCLPDEKSVTTIDGQHHQSSRALPGNGIDRSNGRRPALIAAVAGPCKTGLFSN